MNLAVIGAGIIGVTSAVAIKEAFPHLNVTIFADVFSPDTTGDGSAGLWGPYILGDTPNEDVIKWSGRTHVWFQELWKAGLTPETGVSLIPCTRLTSASEGYPEPLWKSVVYGAQKLTEQELRRLNEEHKANYTGGWQFLTYTCEPVRMLPWLMKKFESLGGNLKRRKIKNMEDLIREGFRTVVNCSGLGARELAVDSTVKPVRGQVTRVDAPWAFHVYIVDDDDGNYIIPNADSVVLGGTHQEGDYDRAVRKDDSIFIHEGCYRMLPALKKSKILKQWVGLRPGRPRVRLEMENLRSKDGQNYTVIHNYGHGGSGVTVSWGCAVDVVEILRGLTKKEFNSKL